MWKLANAATKALTVDNSLHSIKKLRGLGLDLNKVPTKRVTFATLQTQDLSTGTQLVQPGAAALFKTIAEDQSLTTASGKAVKSASATPTVPPSAIRIQVQNGSEKDGLLVQGRAGDVQKELVNRGFTKATAITGTATPTTTVSYPAGQKAQAQSVAKALGIPSKDLKQSATATGVVLVVGSDWPTGTTFPGGRTDATDADRKTALNGSNEQLGNETAKCAPVSKFNNVIGVDRYGHLTTGDDAVSGVSPARAYEMSPNVKDSAP
jgi:LytR cell envelope-related transcriptional attenuator